MTVEESFATNHCIDTCFLQLFLVGSIEVYPNCIQIYSGSKWDVLRICVRIVKSNRIDIASLECEICPNSVTVAVDSSLFRQYNRQ